MHGAVPAPCGALGLSLSSPMLGVFARARDARSREAASMLVRITPQGLQALGRDAFLRRMIDVLARSDAERKFLESSPGQEELGRQCSVAETGGFSNSYDIARFIAAAWLLGPDFVDRFPAMREAFDRHDLSATERADLIEDQTKTLLTVLQGQS